MLNSSARKSAIERLKNLATKYESKADEVKLSAVELHQLRVDTSQSIILSCETYLSSLANAPKQLKKSVVNLKLEYQSFEENIHQLEEEAETVGVNSRTGAASGVAAGVGVAALAPSAALAVATTFGAASTGTAISALSGAAATNAALAWLGGGAIAAGGGGMAGGNALLALAGPIGWTIGAAGLLGAGGYAFYKNNQIIEDANNKSVNVVEQINKLKEAHQGVGNFIKLTKKHSKGVKDQLKLLRSEAPDNYLKFSAENKNMLGALINNVNSLSKLLNKEIVIK